MITEAAARESLARIGHGLESACALVAAGAVPSRETLKAMAEAFATLALLSRWLQRRVEQDVEMPPTREWTPVGPGPIRS